MTKERIDTMRESINEFFETNDDPSFIFLARDGDGINGASVGHDYEFAGMIDQFLVENPEVAMMMFMRLMQGMNLSDNDNKKH